MLDPTDRSDLAYETDGDFVYSLDVGGGREARWCYRIEAFFLGLYEPGADEPIDEWRFETQDALNDALNSLSSNC